MRLGEEARATAWCEDRYGPDGSRFLDGGLDELAPADQTALQDETFATALMTTFGEAFRQGVNAYAHDVVLQARPWQFDSGSIVAPVWIHHGEGADAVAADRPWPPHRQAHPGHELVV